MKKELGMLIWAIRWHRANTSVWDGMKKKMMRRFIWSSMYIGVFLLLTGTWHYIIRNVPAESFGILLVALGAAKLAQVSARFRIGEFFEITHASQAVNRNLTENRYPRIAGNMIDTLIGFSLIAIGFTIRVAADFLNL